MIPKKIICVLLVLALVLSATPGVMALERLEMPDSDPLSEEIDLNFNAGEDIRVQGEESNSNGDEDDGLRDKLIIGGIAAGVTVGTFFLGRYAYQRYQASSYYDQAQDYAARGEWDRAVEAYETALSYHSGHSEAEEGLSEARQEAEAMFIARGDEARQEERYEDAVEYYQEALNYNPDSVTAQSHLDELAQEMVEVHYRRGYEYETQNRWEEALAEYEKAYQYNLEYEDLDDRYYRARARIEGELPMRALLYIVNRTDLENVERPLLNSLQERLEAIVEPDFYMISRSRVQEVMDEQADALVEERGPEEAVELGRIMGADEVLIGELTEIYSSWGRLHMDVNLEILNVESEDTVSEIEYSHNFGRGVSREEISKYLNEIAVSLVEEKFE